MSFVTPRRILSAGWLVFLICMYPGFMQTDAADQLFDSRAGALTDWHSPVMTTVWRIVGLVISGPAGMLLLQSGLVLWGTYVLLRHVMSDRAAAWTSVGLLLFPPASVFTALISADAQLTAFAVAGAAALASTRPWMHVLGLGSLALATGMRDGGALATLPIVVAMFRWRDLAGWRRAAAGFVVWLVLVLAAAGLERVLVDAKTERNEVLLAMTDIVGTLRRAALSDAEIREAVGTGLAEGISGFTDRAAVLDGKPSRFVGEDGIFAPPDTATRRADVIEGRRALRKAAPGSYLAHRWNRFTQVLGFSRARPTPYTEFVEESSQATVLRHRARHSGIQDAALAPVRWIARTPLARPYVYFIVALVLLPLALVRRDRLAAMLLASGILFELSLMLVVVRVAPRNSHWLIVASIIAIVLMIVRRARRPSPNA